VSLFGIALATQASVASAAPAARPASARPAAGDRPGGDRPAAEPAVAGDHRAGDHRAGDHRAGDHRAGDHRAGDHRAGDHRARDRTAQDPPARDRPAAAGTDPERYPEDRAFTGDPGAEPPPPPVRRRPLRRPERPRRVRPPARPGTSAAPETPEPKDLLVPPGPNLLTGALGFSAGLTRHTVGGFHLNLDWSYQMTRHLWFDFMGNLTFGGACRVVETEPGTDRALDSDCGAFRGIGIDLLAGIQVKFLSTKLWTAPVVPFARAAAGVAFIVSDTPNDGAALVFRLGGGARYYFTPRFSVGGELSLTLGPAWRNHLDTGLYAAIALLAGVEFLI